MALQFPRTMVGGVSLPRMLIGSNWIAGFSHTSPAADAQIRCRYSDRHRVAQLIEAYLEYDINAMMAIFKPNDPMLDGVKEAEDRTGKKVILIDTPPMNMDDNAQARAEAEARIALSRKWAAPSASPTTPAPNSW